MLKSCWVTPTWRANRPTWLLISAEGVIWKKCLVALCDANLFTCIPQSEIYCFEKEGTKRNTATVILDFVGFLSDQTIANRINTRKAPSKSLTTMGYCARAYKGDVSAGRFEMSPTSSVLVETRALRTTGLLQGHVIEQRSLHPTLFCFSPDTSSFSILKNEISFPIFFVRVSLIIVFLIH